MCLNSIGNTEKWTFELRAGPIKEGTDRSKKKKRAKKLKFLLVLKILKKNKTDLCNMLVKIYSFRCDFETPFTSLKLIEIYNMNI